MKRVVSIQDIAQTAGVSHTTVSRALHNSPLISTEVKENIQRLAREMSYTPNLVAQSLKSQRTHTIGLVVTTIADPFLGRVVRGIEDVAQRSGFSLILSLSYNDPELEMAAIETFQRRRVDGILVAAPKISAQYESRLARVNVPTVLINQQAETPFDDVRLAKTLALRAPLYSVSVDDYDGARQAVRHLLDLGHRRIGYLGAFNRPLSNRRRLDGYRDALAQAGQPVDPCLTIFASAEHRYHSDDLNDGQELLLSLLGCGVSAVFCYNDMIAIGALLACRQGGIAVPQQLSIVGFDDIEATEFVTPTLTTVHQPKLRLGQLAMEMILALMADQPVEDHILPTELVVRDSTCRIQE